MFVFSVIGFEYHLNSESLSHYSGLKKIFHLKELMGNYILTAIFFDLYLYLFFAINLYLLIWLIKNYSILEFVICFEYIQRCKTN